MQNNCTYALGVIMQTTRDELGDQVKKLKNTYALISAAKKNDLNSVCQLIGEGVDFKQKTFEVYSALMYAAYHRNEEMVDILITAGADVNEENRQGCTALILAVRSRHEGIVKKLIDKGAKHPLQDSPLMCASKNSNMACLDLLIDAKASIPKDENQQAQLLENLHHLDESSRVNAIIKLLSYNGKILSHLSDAEKNKISFFWKVKGIKCSSNEDLRQAYIQKLQNKEMLALILSAIFTALGSVITAGVIDFSMPTLHLGIGIALTAIAGIYLLTRSVQHIHGFFNQNRSNQQEIVSQTPNLN